MKESTRLCRSYTQFRAHIFAGHIHSSEHSSLQVIHTFVSTYLQGMGTSSLDGSAEDNGGGGSFSVRANAAAREVVAVLEVSGCCSREDVQE
jgi:hypothetical protein